MSEGSAPENIHEVAITPTVRETFGMDIGDTIEIDYDGKKEKCTVVGVFQCMNSLGAVIRIYDDVPTSFTHYVGSMCRQISFYG